MSPGNLATLLIGFIDRISCRITSTTRLKDVIIAQYRDQQLADKYYQRLHFIENKIDIPEYEQVHNPLLEIVYIGRGAPQKRVYLIAAIAAKMYALGLPAHFSFVGDVDKVIDPNDFPFCKFYGNVNDDALMQEIYRQSDVLILTSAYEGLPLVVMYMMAYGKVVLSTAVNGIPDYIAHLQNGLLIRATDEQSIIDEGVELLQLLIDQPDLKFELGRKAGRWLSKNSEEPYFAGNTGRYYVLVRNRNVPEIHFSDGKLLLSSPYHPFLYTRPAPYDIF